VEVRLLGPLHLVRDGQPEEVKGSGERELLALLATAPRRAFTKEGLIDALWEESPPANPDNALQQRVSKLRKMLGDALVTAVPGYLLDVADDAVDILRFADLVRQRRYGEALGLWRGEPLAEFVAQPWARAEAARLNELHATAVEEHVDERLAAGDHVALVSELEGLVAAAPLRERLRGQQMLALYRCGRAADALAVYQAFRRVLNEELGVEPSADLRGLEAGILREDESLDPPVNRTRGSGNVPMPLTAVLGRDEQMQLVQDLVAEARLVTLTGPGGVGKTTLATAVARGVGDAFPDGAWFVPLAAVETGDRVPDAIADTVGLSDPDRSSASRLVRAWLSPRHSLLVLDNCEHLADACAEFVEGLLRAADQPLRILVTSREPLGVPGEVQVPVPPLDEPDAVRLFAERATSVSPDFETDANLDAIRRICQRLDGMPLAIELAAARIKTLTPGQIAARLDDRFRLLTLAPRTAEARHQTLRATVAWSHDLLDLDPKKFFRRLAAFPGGWTLAAAEAVAGQDLDDEVLDLLGHLVDRSLVVSDHGRFRMLETIRAYAQEQLDLAGEEGPVARRHAEFFINFAEAAEPHLRGAQQAQWLATLHAEDANLRQAMSWVIAHRDEEPDAALRLGGALGWYWYVGRQVDGRGFLREALESPPGASALNRAHALQALSLAVRPVGCIVHPSAEGAVAAAESFELFQQQHDFGRAALSQLLLAVEGVGRPDAGEQFVLVEQARRTLQEHDDTWGVALADFVEMEIRLHHGHVDRALALGHQASASFDSLDDDWGRSAVMLHLGYGLRVAGRIDEAKQLLARAVVLSRDGGLPNNLARSLAELAESELARGEPDAAEPWIDQCEVVARELGNDTLLALAMLARAGAARLRGAPRESLDGYVKALNLSVQANFPKGVARARNGLAASHLDEGSVDEARTELDCVRPLALELGDVTIVATVLEQSARLAAHDGDATEQERTLREATNLRTEHGRPPTALDQPAAPLGATSGGR
jgi:predicted ATPase/DNA-binding SARP family transcriptional activator